MQEWEAEKEPNFVANCISQNIETCAKKGYQLDSRKCSLPIECYRIIVYCHCTSNHWLINNPNTTK